MYDLRHTIGLISAIFLISSQSLHAAAQDPVAVSTVYKQNCLIIGGGPDRIHNQVAIESNVRYVRKLLPPNTRIRVFYDGGNLHMPVVQYEDKNGDIKYRKSVLEHVDGPAKLEPVDKEMKALLSTGDPTLLYFTGHGSPDLIGGYKDNMFDLWKHEGISVSRLTQTIKGIPDSVPITIVMVQCFSGAFAQVFFPPPNDKDKLPIRPNSCGFFSSIPQQESAGCTPEVNEANYHDFTTYFFGALSGHDRVGRVVTDADYNHDGIVGMDEAYVYALIHDRSIDTPMATSDAYVRLYSKESDSAIFSNSYADVLKWASPAQRTGLEEISKKLHLADDDRLKEAYKKFKIKLAIPFNIGAFDEDISLWTRYIRLAKTVVLEHEILNSQDTRIRDGLTNLLSMEAKNPLIGR